MKSLFYLITLAALLEISASSQYHATPALRPLPFPRVYTANIPLPGNKTRGEDTSSLAAEVDLLTVINKSNGTATISFLVHNAAQLKHIQALARLPRMKVRHMQLNPKLTSELKLPQRNSLDGEGHQRSRSVYSTISGFPCYKDLQGTFDWMNAMVTRAKTIPGLSVTMIDIGDSYLKTADANAGYDMWVLKITGEGAISSTTSKGVFFVMTGIHAREYAPPELASRWGEVLIDSYGNDADMTAMLDHTEIHLVLQSNPDGRQVAETDPNTMRRKNLNPNGSESTCGDSIGVDLNRNFPFRWGLNSGSSADKCSNTYRGTAPASEPEVQAIVEYCKSIFPEGQRKADPEAQQEEAYDVNTTMGVFLDIHSFGELIIWPWGHENVESSNDNELEALASKYQHFNKYTFAGPNTPAFLYEVSGASNDWAFGALGAAGMTFELGTTFFQDCDYFENSILDGNMKALTYGAKISKAPYSMAKGPDVTDLSTSVSGGTLTVKTAASDSAWSSSNHPTSQQGVTEIRVSVDVHPYDASVDGQIGSLVTGDSVDIDVASLTDGRHIVFVQATDGDGYKGPVTAAYFTKGDSPGIPSSGPVTAPSTFPAASPVATMPTTAPVAAPTLAPVAPPGNAPVALPSGSPVTAPVGPPVAPSSCDDSADTFLVDVIGEDKDCDWLAINMIRFSYLCEFMTIAGACPRTCGLCNGGI